MYHCIESKEASQSTQIGIIVNPSWVQTDAITTQQRQEFISRPIPDLYRWYIWKVLYAAVLLISGLTLLITGVVITAAFTGMMLEIFCFVYISIFLYALIASRFPHRDRHQHEFWLGVFRFLLDQRSDRLLRVIVINRILSRQHLSIAFRNYLDTEQNKCVDVAYQEVTYHSLKVNQ